MISMGDARCGVGYKLNIDYNKRREHIANFLRKYIGIYSQVLKRQAIPDKRAVAKLAAINFKEEYRDINSIVNQNSDIIQSLDQIAQDYNWFTNFLSLKDPTKVPVLYKVEMLKGLYDLHEFYGDSAIRSTYMTSENRELNKILKYVYADIIK